MPISPELAGKFYWPRDDFSTPADNLCWHVPPAPDRDYRCVRPSDHPGKHGYAWSPVIKDHSHKQSYPEVCPVCSGDCAGANPPVLNCPSRGA